MADDENAGSRAAGLESSSSVSSQGQSSDSLQGLEPLSPEMGVVKSTSEPNVPGKECGRSESTSNSQPANPEQESTAPPEQDLDNSPQLAVQLRPLLLKNSRPAAVTDGQDFDFWTKPERRGEQASENQPISSPKLWPGSHNSRAPQEGAVTSPLADRGAFSVRDSYALPEGTLESVSSLGDSEVGEFGEDGLSAMALQERGSEKDREDPEKKNPRQVEVAQSSVGKDSCQVILQKEAQQLVPVLEKEENAEGGCREISECGADRAESSFSAFATNPASSSSSTFNSSFSIKGGPSTGKEVGLELAVVPEGRGLVRIESEGHLSDSASVSSSTATLSRKHRYGETNTVLSKSLDSSLKAVSGRVSEEIASTSGRGDDSKAGQNEGCVSHRPLYTDTPAMANDVVFGISTFGKLGRSRSFATGSIKGATVFAADEKGSGHRRAHSEVKKVSFHLENAAEGKMGGASSLRSPRHAIELKTQVEVGHDSCRGKGKEKIAGPGSAAEIQRKQSAEKADQASAAGSKKTENAAANGLKSSEVEKEGVHKGARGEGEIVKEGPERGGSSEGSPKGESSGQLAVAEGGSPKVIDRSALFKRWMEKNKSEAGLPEEHKGLSPTPILQRIGSSNDVLPPTSARRREDPFLKRTTSQSAISPPGYRLSGEIQSLEGGFESPLPSPRRKSLSMPSSPAGNTPGKHVRQLSIGASKPPKAPRSPPASPLPPKSPSSKPRDASRSPREKAVSNLTLGPAVIDASVDLGPSTSSPGGSPQTPKGASRNLGRLPPARIPSPKTNSVLRKAMSQSKADASIHVGAELVDAGLPADPKDAIPQLIARIIRATSKNHPLLLGPPPSKQAVQPAAPKLSQVAPLPQKRGPGSKGTSSSEPETASIPAATQRRPPPLDTSPEGLGRPPSDGVSSAPEDSSYFAASLMSLSPRALLRSASLPSYLQSVLPTSLLNTFSAQVSLTAPEPRQLTDAPPESPKPSLNPEETILLLGRLALAGEFEQEHGRALLAQAKGAVVSTLLEVLQGGSQMDREAAVGLTRVLTLLEEGRNTLLESDGLKLLVDLLWSGTPRAKVAAAGTLRNLAYKSTDQKCAIMAAGAIGPLVSLLRSTTPGAPEAAASALRSLAMADGMEEIIVQNGAIQPLVKDLRQHLLVHLLHSPQSPAAKEASAATLQNLATHDEHRGVIVQSGAIPALFKMLLAPEISSQMAAAGALRNLAAGGPEYQKAIGQSGAVGPLIKILGKRGPNVPPGMPEAAAGALANLALHEDNKPLVSREGGIPALTELVKSGTPSAQLVGMEALKNLATHPKNCELIVKAGAVPWLVRNLGSSDRRLQRSAVRTLFTVGGQAENLKAISEQGTLQVLEKIVNGQTGLERDDFVVKLLLKLKSM